MRWLVPLFLGWVVFGACLSVRADVFGSGTNTFAIDFVNIGNAGNAADTRVGTGSRGRGSVAYDYRIGVYEISQDSITKATASGMSNVTAGRWTNDRPAARITWYEAAAFVNWLNTSSGYQAAYNLTFTTNWSMSLWDSTDAWTRGGTNLYRHKDALYFLPSENEWYKAAYYNPAGTNYFRYPTRSNTEPRPTPGGTNNDTAVFDQQIAPAAVTNAGGLSAYGTMAQGGNVEEWMETAFDGTNSLANENRMVRGGFFDGDDAPNFLVSTDRTTSRAPTASLDGMGFRVASVPDPFTSLEDAASAPLFDPVTAVNWSAGGTTWTVDRSVTHDGVDSVRAQTTHGQSTYREYSVTGPAVVDFWWKVSSERNFDTFSYSLNGVNQQTISGEVDWAYRTLTLPAGTHAIRWTYTKDESGAVGQDAGWLDDFAVYPATATLQVRDGSTVLDGEVTVDFGSADLGSAGFTKTLTFANEGYVPMEVQLSLPQGSSFTFDGGASTYDLLVGRGESVALPITLATTAAGTKSAQLTITAPDIPFWLPPIVTLSGHVRGPDIGLTQGATALTSGQTFDMGLAPRTVEFTIRNSGNVGDLVISAISATGNFQITQQPATTVAVGGSTTFKVLVSDSQQGVQFGSISISSNDEDTPVFTIPVTSRALLGLGTGATTDSTTTGGQGGGVGWDFATTSLPNGTTGSALKTGATPHNGQSHLQATFTGAGLLSWKWKVATQENFDWLACEINGREVLAVSTKNAAWREQVVYVPNNGVVKWLYRKDASGTIGEDAAYLADISFERFTVPQVSYSNWWASSGRPTPPAATSPLARSGLPSVMSWVGGFNPNTGPATNHYRPIIESGQLKLIYPVSRKYSGGSVTAEYSTDLSGEWSGAGLTQRLHSQDADTVIIEATPPAGAEKGFMRLNVR